MRRDGAVIAQLLRDFPDEQLDRTTTAFGNRELTLERVVEWIVIGHTNAHLASIRATVAT